MTFTKEQQKAIKDAIREKGYSLGGYCKINQMKHCTFGRVLDNSRGQSNLPSPECDRIIKILTDDGLLKGETILEAEAA